MLLCDSVVVMVAMCNIMFYKIVLLSSGHRTYKLATPRKKKKERKKDISDWENEPANKLLTTESTNIQTNRKTFSFLIFRLVYFMCIAFIGDFLFPMLIYLINSPLTSARPLCSSHFRWIDINTQTQIHIYMNMSEKRESTRTKWMERGGED